MMRRTNQIFNINMVIWDCCKKCICRDCKRNETVHYKLPKGYCDNCDMCDLGDFARDKCRSYMASDIDYSKKK